MLLARAALAFGGGRTAPPTVFSTFDPAAHGADQSLSAGNLRLQGGSSSDEQAWATQANAYLRGQRRYGVHAANNGGHAPYPLIGYAATDNASQGGIGVRNAIFGADGNFYFNGATIAAGYGAGAFVGAWVAPEIDLDLAQQFIWVAGVRYGPFDVSPMVAHGVGITPFVITLGASSDLTANFGASSPSAGVEPGFVGWGAP